MAISEAFKIKQATNLSVEDSNGHFIKLKTKTEDLFAIADSGSSMSFLNGKTARRLQENDNSVILKQIPPEDTARNLACYNGKTIVPEGRLIVTIESGGWKIKAAPFIIVDNQKANIIDRIILPQVGIRLIQEKSKQGNVLNISEQEQSNPEIKRWVKDNYPQLRIRVGKSKSHVIRTQFNKEFIPVQQKVRRVPVHLQERVEKEFNELLDQKHIIKLDKCSDRQLISPIVITVRKDQTVKLALDSKIVNKFIHKNKYQTPNIDLLLDNVAQVVKSNDNQQTLFSTLDLRYAFSQIPLDKSTQEQCNFSLIGSIATGTYQF